MTAPTGNGALVFAWLPQPIGGMTVMQQGFFDSFFAFVSHDTNNRRIFGGYTFCGTGYIASGRNTLCEKFLDTDAEWMLMVDWDITFTPESVYALLDAADPIERPIISGCYVTYFGANQALRPCWMRERDGQRFVPVDEVEIGEVVECSVVGMGFTLIHRSALEAIAKQNPDEPWKWFGHDIVSGDRVGEDITFCSRATDAGLTIWGHGGVLLGHTKSKTFIVEDIASSAFNHPRSTPRDKRRVLNVGGASKLFALPPQYAGWDHVLLDIEPGADVDVVADAAVLGGLAGYDYDGTITAGVEPAEPYLVISGRTKAEAGPLKVFGDRALHRRSGEPGDREDAARFKARTIEDHDISLFWEDDPLQADMIRAATECLVITPTSPLWDPFDTVYCSHTLEHFTADDMPTVLAGFRRMLRPGGTIDIHVPDGDAIKRLIEEIGMDGVAYESPAGPITPHDMIHGHQATIDAGGIHMMHHMVFTARSLKRALTAAGFVTVKVTHFTDGYELRASAATPKRKGEK